MSKRAPSAYNLFVKKHMAELKAEFEQAGRLFKASEAMALIGHMWSREHGKSPARKSPKSKKSAGCDTRWVEKCAALDKVCHVSPKSGRRSCRQTPEEKKAKAAAAAKAYRLKKKAEKAEKA